MTNIVHWKEIVLRYFADADLFDKICRAVLFCQRTDQPTRKAFDKLDIEKQEKYDLTRWWMRKHGWFSRYIEKDTLCFLCLIPANERNYITIPQFIDRQQTEGLEDDIEEYYNTRPVINDVVKEINKPKHRADLDGSDDEGGFL